MKNFFKSTARRNRERVGPEYGEYLRNHGFEEDGRKRVLPRFRGYIWYFRSSDFLLCISIERPNSIALSGAPPDVEPDAWYANSFPLHTVAKWFDVGADIHPQWVIGPSAAVMKQLHDRFTQFFAASGEAERDRFKTFARRRTS